MANVEGLIKAEITRLSKKVAKQHFSPLHATIQSQRRELSQLRSRLAELERTLKSVGREKKVKVEPTDETKLRFRAEGFRKHRERLGISAEDAGKLLGVSGQTVYNWEHGKAMPRKSQLPAIATLRGLGKREAQRKLEEGAAS
jgi:DNA-binding XRE family transcriptional regulator